MAEEGASPSKKTSRSLDNSADDDEVKQYAIVTERLTELQQDTLVFKPVPGKRSRYKRLMKMFVDAFCPFPEDQVTKLASFGRTEVQRRLKQQVHRISTELDEMQKHALGKKSIDAHLAQQETLVQRLKEWHELMEGTAWRLNHLYHLGYLRDVSVSQRFMDIVGHSDFIPIIAVAQIVQQYTAESTVDKLIAIAKQEDEKQLGSLVFRNIRLRHIQYAPESFVRGVPSLHSREEHEIQVAGSEKCYTALQQAMQAHQSEWSEGIDIVSGASYVSMSTSPSTMEAVAVLRCGMYLDLKDYHNIQILSLTWLPEGWVDGSSNRQNASAKIFPRTAVVSDEDNTAFSDVLPMYLSACPALRYIEVVTVMGMLPEAEDCPHFVRCVWDRDIDTKLMTGEQVFVWT